MPFDFVAAQADRARQRGDHQRVGIVGPEPGRVGEHDHASRMLAARALRATHRAGQPPGWGDGKSGLEARRASATRRGRISLREFGRYRIVWRDARAEFPGALLPVRTGPHGVAAAARSASVPRSSGRHATSSGRMPSAARPS